MVTIAEVQVFADDAEQRILSTGTLITQLEGAGIPIPKDANDRIALAVSLFGAARDDFAKAKLTTDSILLDRLTRLALDGFQRASRDAQQAIDQLNNLVPAAVIPGTSSTGLNVGKQKFVLGIGIGLAALGALAVFTRLRS